LALAIIDFLNTSAKDGSIDSSEAESVEIATNCISEVFHVDPNDKNAMHDALGGQNLLSIYGVYEKMKGRTNSSTSSSSTSTSTDQTSSNTSSGNSPTPESEKLKSEGNTAMQRRDYPEAVTLYTRALEICPLNPIYLSNRAAAYSNMFKHDLARNDAELATATDPKYTKAWSRLGFALFALGDSKASMEAYQKGIEAEGNGGSEVMKKGYETAKRKMEEEDVDGKDENGSEVERGSGDGGLPDLSSLAGMFGGGGAGGSGGGMPDLAGLMNNPMMKQMAQKLMSNPDMMNNILNNPQLKNMAGKFGGNNGGSGSGGTGGGMPDMSALMNDPNIAEM